MSQSAKGSVSQGGADFARRGKAGAVRDDALRYAAAAFARAGFADANLVLRWAEIAGPDVARFARPVKLQEGQSGAVLTITCDPGAIVFLQHQTRGLIERLNAYLGARRIARLKLVPGKITPAPEPAHPLPIPEAWSESSPKRALPEALERLAQLREKAKVSGPLSRPDGMAD